MVKTAGFTFASRLFAAILYFSLIILVSRWLGPEIRGVCGFYLVIIAITTGISDIAGGAAAPFLLKQYSASRLMAGQMIWAVVPSVLVPLSFVFFSDISLIEFLLLALAGWLNSTWSIQQQILLGYKMFSAFNIMTIAIPAVSISGFILFSLFDIISALSYLSSITVAYFSALLAGFYLLRGAIQAQEMVKKSGGNREIFLKGFQNQVSHLVSLLNSRLIFFVLPAASLGLWSNTLSMGEAFFLIPGSLGQVAYGLVAANTGKDNINQTFQRAWWGNIIVIIPCIIFAAWVPDSFWQWIFGKNFIGISSLLKLALPGIGLHSLYILVSYRQSASGNFHYNFYALVAGFCVNVLATLMLHLSGKYSLEGGIIALVAGWGTASLVSLFILRYTNRGAFRTIISLSKQTRIE